MSQVFDLALSPLNSGMSVIEASAGTGKTYCLAGLVVRHLVEKAELEIGQILVVTFTRAAADELQTRIREALRHALDLLSLPSFPEEGEPYLRILHERFGPEGALRLRRALLHFDDLSVATIHGFAKQMLEVNAFESGLPFDLKLLDNDEALVGEAGADVWRTLLYPEENSLLGALAVARELGPHSFLADAREKARHPLITIQPCPLELGKAVVELENRHRSLRPFDSAGLRLALTRLRFREPAQWSPAALKNLVEDVKAFVEGDVAMLPLAERLLPKHLEKALEKGQKEALEAISWLFELERFFAQVDLTVHALRGRFLDELASRLEKLKVRSETMVFDDLLGRLHKALADRENGGNLRRALRRRFEVALIDEFQDTDLFQFEIFRDLFRQSTLILIGDPKQAIYRFRGADVFAYLAARRQADRVESLERNWRSVPDLVNALNLLFTASPRPFWLSDIALHPLRAAKDGQAFSLSGDGGAALEWLWLERESNGELAEAKIAAGIAAEIVQLLTRPTVLLEQGKARALEPADIAVLTRTHTEATSIQNALRRAGIAAVVGRSGSLFETEELGELELLLRAMTAPARQRVMRRALATLLFGLDAAELMALSRDDASWQTQIESFEAWLALWRDRGVLVMLQELFSERRVHERLLALADGERRLTNLLQALELLHEIEKDQELGPRGLLSWLERARRQRGETRDQSELRLESDARAVKIATIHKSKGLEYNIVFCPFLWRARSAKPPFLVHEQNGMRLVFAIGARNDEAAEQAEAERLAEDLRLAYVALTRARYRVSIVWGEIGSTVAQTALAYLLHQKQEGQGGPRAVIEEIDGRRAFWHADLEALVRRSAGTMQLRPLAADIVERPGTAAAPATELAARPFHRGIARDFWQIASFTRLTAGAARIEVELAEHEDPAWPIRPTKAAAGLLAFARGRRTGDCLHQILEKWSFAPPSRDPSLADLIETTLLDYALDAPAAHSGGPLFSPRAAVIDLLERLSACAVPGSDQAFAELDPRKRLIEWSFHLPLARYHAPALADLLRLFADELPAGYPERIAGLGREMLHGFLTGFVDLIFESEGRFFLIDWKSNFLGDEVKDYDRQALEIAMSEHHYPLQYLLYTVALDRFLKQRLTGYDYEAHFGGVAYIFLRGLDLIPGKTLFEPQRARHGILATRPSRALINDLGNWLSGIAS